MPLQRFDNDFLDQLASKARVNERRRAHHNVHETLDEKCQRLFVSMEPDSYVAPHRHSNPAKPEFFLGVRGHLVLFILNDDGQVMEAINIGPGQPLIGCDVPPNTWHTVVSMESSSVFVEAKPGPYQPIDTGDVALWSTGDPEEQQAYIRWLKSKLVSS